MLNSFHLEKNILLIVVTLCSGIFYGQNKNFEIEWNFNDENGDNPKNNVNEDNDRIWFSANVNCNPNVLNPQIATFSNSSFRSGYNSSGFSTCKVYDGVVSGLKGCAENDYSIGGKNWTTSNAENFSQYIEFGIDKDTSFDINNFEVTNNKLSFYTYSSNNGPKNFALQALILDKSGGVIQQFNYGQFKSNSKSLNIQDLSDIQEVDINNIFEYLKKNPTINFKKISFRIYPFNASSKSGGFRVDEFNLKFDYSGNYCEPIPAIEKEFTICKGVYASININRNNGLNYIKNLLSNYDIILKLDLDSNRVEDTGFEPIRLLMEDSFYPANLFKYLESRTDLVTGNYIVEVYMNDKGGFPLNSNNTNGNNELNENYSCCLFITNTFLTVYSAYAGELQLKENQTENGTNSICLGSSDYLTVDGKKYDKGFRLYEDGYDKDANGNDIKYDYYFEVINDNENPNSKSVLEVDKVTGKITTKNIGTAKVRFTAITPSAATCGVFSEIEITVFDKQSLKVKENSKTTFCYEEDDIQFPTIVDESNQPVTGIWTLKGETTVLSSPENTKIETYTFTPDGGCYKPLDVEIKILDKIITTDIEIIE